MYSISLSIFMHEVMFYFFIHHILYRALIVTKNESSNRWGKQKNTTTLTGFLSLVHFLTLTFPLTSILSILLIVHCLIVYLTYPILFCWVIPISFYRFGNVQSGRHCGLSQVVALLEKDPSCVWARLPFCIDHEIRLVWAFGCHNLEWLSK